MLWGILIFRWFVKIAILTISTSGYLDPFLLLLTLFQTFSLRPHIENYYIYCMYNGTEQSVYLLLRVVRCHIILHLSTPRISSIIAIVPLFRSVSVTSVVGCGPMAAQCLRWWPSNLYDWIGISFKSYRRLLSIAVTTAAILGTGIIGLVWRSVFPFSWCCCEGSFVHEHMRVGEFEADILNFSIKSLSLSILRD